MASRPWCNMRIDYWNNFKGTALVGGFFFIKVLKFTYNSTCYYNENEWNKNEIKTCIYVNFIECKASYSREIYKSIFLFLLVPASKFKIKKNKNGTKILLSIYIYFIECKSSYSQEICKSILVFLLARWLIAFII